MIGGAGGGGSGGGGGGGGGGGRGESRVVVKNMAEIAVATLKILSPTSSEENSKVNETEMGIVLEAQGGS
ncbi:hypothetical protein HZH66_001606 [Vespula vulgaris]|uniref:Uncharacterized protein n=1 Tax=Vespula vulgaris TaxID=7454 RepID=A0A834NJR0_VESVU|nr:hypothetical protein HZH66_001606 [Vespula vulgaris]